MVYTIGRTEAYEAELDAGPVEKRGRSSAEGYPGGSVWRDFDDALRDCPPGYSVYGVDADWDNDTAPSRDGDWHDLLRDAPIVRLCTPPAPFA